VRVPVETPRLRWHAGLEFDPPPPRECVAIRSRLGDASVDDVGQDVEVSANRADMGSYAKGARKPMLRARCSRSFAPTRQSGSSAAP